MGHLARAERLSPSRTCHVVLNVNLWMHVYAKFVLSCISICMLHVQIYTSRKLAIRLKLELHWLSLLSIRM